MGDFLDVLFSLLATAPSTGGAKNESSPVTVILGAIIFCAIVGFLLGIGSIKLFPHAFPELATSKQYLVTLPLAAGTIAGLLALAIGALTSISTSNNIGTNGDRNTNTRDTRSQLNTIWNRISIPLLFVGVVTFGIVGARFVI